MKLSEKFPKLKEVPKQKIAVICVLVLILISTVAFAVAVADKASAPKSESTGDTVNEEGDSVGVFKPSDDISDTPVTLDLSGTAGLDYISRGDGTCYIAGIGTCTLTELEIPSVSPSGDRVTKIYDNAFSDCTQLLTVTVPSSVKAIGTGVFRGCENLVAINVDTDNSAYCSVGGVLFSKDKTVLVCYPMNRTGESYLLSTDVKAISAFAFEEATNLKRLLFEGNIASFQRIDILMGNGVLDKVSITCNYVALK